jgi:hypothetical protein
MTSDVEHLFVCLFAICISSFVKCSILLPILIIDLLVFLLLTYMGSLYILGEMHLLIYMVHKYF